MTECAASTSGKDSIQQLLVFQIQDIDFGVDTRQVASIRDPQSINQDEIQILKLHELIPFKGRSYRSPKILIVNSQTERKAILVEAPDDIIFIGPGDIKPIPGLILKLNRSKAIWGVLSKAGKTILILDIFDLLAEDSELKIAR